jgi:dihydrofolate reductase
MGKGTYGSMRGRPMKKKKVVGKRKKLDMDRDGKLTKKDFAMLRNKKKARA